MKYYMKPPKNLSKLPEDYVKLQKKFYKRAFKEILEVCSQNLGGNIYLSIYDLNGTQIKSFE